MLAVGLALLPVSRAVAHPYASGLTNQAGTISWVLNESATDVKILFDNGKVTNDLGFTPVLGTNTFSLATHTNFAIVVSNTGSGALTQISSDGNINNNIYGPRGVAVNKNPKCWNFGRIYVASANPGTSGNRTTTKGIYVMDAASEDFLGLGSTAATAGITFGGSTTYSPFKLGVGPDDTLYVGDGATGVIGGVWRTDPNLLNSTNIFGLANPSTNRASHGTNFGEIIGTPNISGSLAGGNLVLTLTAWNLNLINSSGGFGSSSSTNYQNIYQYNIGSGPLPWKSYPIVLTNPIGLGTVNGAVMDVQIAPDGKYFITAMRTSASDGATNVCVLNSAGTRVLWDSKTQSAAYFGDTVNDHLCLQNYSIAVSPDDQFVLVQGAANNNFLLMSLTNGVPDISTLTTNTKVGTGGGPTCWASTWDAADNIYVTSGGSDTLRIFSMGLTTTCVTSNDLTCTNGGFQMTAIPAVVGTDNAQLISVSLPAGTPVMPRTLFTQTWMMTNTGTSIWLPGDSGYTLNIIGEDSLGAMPLAANTISSRYTSGASIAGGAAVPPGGVATFSMMFTAPEAPGTYADTFQLNNVSGVCFGPQVTVQVVVEKAGSTSQYDRARTVSYANNYAGYICSDGYYWTDSSDYSYTNCGTNLVPVPPVTGDDCAHFVSCCIGSEPNVRGGGLPIPSRTATYGEPGAGNLIYTVLIPGGYAVEVSSLSELSPGDLVGWNWEGITNSDAADIDHVTLYLGNELLASHANSALDVSATTWYNGVHHYIHIFDAPTVKMSASGHNLVLSWTTNWAGYVLQSSASLSPAATWHNVTNTPVQAGALIFVTNTMSQSALFYRLMYP